MNCPVCKIPLNLSERQGVEIDYCPQCRGVWLDRGELDKIIEKSLPGGSPRGETPSASMQVAPEPTYQKRYEPGHHYDQHEGHHGKKRHKSWLSEIFD
jgi:uncharacterized protein